VRGRGAAASSSSSVPPVANSSSTSSTNTSHRVQGAAKESGAMESSGSGVGSSNGPHDSDGWKAIHSDHTKRRYVMECLSGGKLGAYGGLNSFVFIPFMPEDNNAVSPATHLMTHDIEFILKSKSEYVQRVGARFLIISCLSPLCLC
jgi:hypothetical protein